MILSLCHCSNDDWCWYLQTQSGDQVVVVEILDMDIEESVNCGADLLQVKDGKFWNKFCYRVCLQGTQLSVLLWKIMSALDSTHSQFFLYQMIILVFNTGIKFVLAEWKIFLAPKEKTHIWFPSSPTETGQNKIYSLKYIAIRVNPVFFSVLQLIRICHTSEVQK